jgi:hypothetical protein
MQYVVLYALLLMRRWKKNKKSFDVLFLRSESELDWTRLRTSVVKCEFYTKKSIQSRRDDSTTTRNVSSPTLGVVLKLHRH